jgi:hypothetical protein
VPHEKSTQNHKKLLANFFNSRSRPLMHPLVIIPTQLQSHKQNTNLAETQPDGTCFDNKPN